MREMELSEEQCRTLSTVRSEYLELANAGVFPPIPFWI
jgi:hypothetical protein